MNTMNDWVNIPAFYLLTAYLSSIVLFTELFPAKASLKKRLAGYGLLAAALSLILFLNPNASGLQFLLCMFSIWGCLLLCFRFVLSTSWRNAGYLTVRAFFVGDFAASLLWQIVFYVMIRTGISDKIQLTLTVMLPGYAVWYLLVFLAERQLRDALPDLNIGRKDLILTLMIGAFLYFLANISYAVDDSPFHASALPQTYILRTLTEFGAVAILLAFHYRLVEIQSRLRLQAMEDASRAQADHLKTYEAGVAMVNQKYHDLKHQLGLLRESVSREERLEYVDEMEKDLEQYEAQHRTGNATLDTVLTAKHMECAQKGICLTCVAEGAALAGMHPLDLSALFGNLLDNAIECEEKIGAPERRLIHISVSRCKANTRICIRNICEEPVEFRGGLPVTTKADTHRHGIGTASVRMITEKYQGSLLMNCRDGWFVVSILLPPME